jgi:hypothetical protein
MKAVSRILLGFSAIVFLFGAWVHTSAFGRVSAAIGKSDLPAFFGNGFRTLWFMDSVVQIVLAILFGLVAIRPIVAAKSIVFLIALIPLCTACFIYYFIGNFIGGHLFLTGGVAAIIGALLMRD